MVILISIVSDAVKRCKVFVLTVFIAYCLSCLTGIIMSHNGNQFAVSSRDNIVGKAMKSDKASINYQEGNKFSAALHDFMGNLFLGAVPQTLMGFGIVIPYFFVLKQGWVGGIVSIDSEHKSRFKNFKSTFYYFLVLLLQFIPYSLAIGAGVKCGIDFYNFNRMNGWNLSKFKIQQNSLFDLCYVYILVVPLFFIASCFEFLSAWNI
jgi:uncharacterized membrane protein SpoIIM required for sporulation